MQLVAYGAQDVYLSGNPQITFFKVVYRRHSNFSMESIQQIFSGTTELGNRVTATISRNGDLIHKMYVEAEISLQFGSIQGYPSDQVLIPQNIKFGHSLIKEVEIEIGGQLIDKHYSRWLNIWSELTIDSGKKEGYNLLTSVSLPADGNPYIDTPYTSKIYCPLQFWFCKNPGLALPLISLQYHEVKININFEKSDILIGTPFKYGIAEILDGNNIEPSIDKDIKSSLWVDYIYLDTDERRRFAQVSHEYLIEQLQFSGIESSNIINHRLNFNHPVKELIWIEQPLTYNDTDLSYENRLFEYIECKSAKLQLNGHDRFEERIGSYFTLVQPYQHHTNIPQQNEILPGKNPYTWSNEYINNTQNNKIHVYSFALKPEDHQPTGTCNFSRIDNATLSITPKDTNSDIYIYAVNYNVLRIMGGMGGLAYSN